MKMTARPRARSNARTRSRLTAPVIASACIGGDCMVVDMTEIEIRPQGPFSLAAAQDFAGGFPAGIGGGGVGAGSITLAFPVEGTEESAAIELWQDADGIVRGRTDAPAALL